MTKSLEALRDELAKEYSTKPNLYLADYQMVAECAVKYGWNQCAEAMKAEISVYKDDLAILEKENAKMRQCLEKIATREGTDSYPSEVWAALLMNLSRECLA